MKDYPRLTQDSPIPVLIVDDDPAIHEITILLLKKYEYKGRKLKFFSAYSASEARESLHENGPFVIILLDAIMETEDAGLKVARFVREELQDNMVRIILRTGLPDTIPQRETMRNYEIDDYREKSELTSDRFHSAITASIRAYMGFQKLQNNNEGIMRVLKATKNLQVIGSQREFANHFLKSAEYIVDDNGKKPISSLFVSRKHENGKRIKDFILSGRGDFHPFSGMDVHNLPQRKLVGQIKKLLKTGDTTRTNSYMATTLISRDDVSYLVYFQQPGGFNRHNQNFLDLYNSQGSIALENHLLNQELLDTHREIIAQMGAIIESRSGELGNHVYRVAEISRMLAEKKGLETRTCELIFFATPLHDIGKVAIPDSILNKPGKLSVEEYEIIKTHTVIGYNILKSNKKDIFRMAAKICLEHHERWDGNGYPKGLKEREISEIARMCSIADVIDAVHSERVYKKAVPFDQALDIIRKGSGREFDPELVEILLDNSRSVKQVLTENNHTEFNPPQGKDSTVDIDWNQQNPMKLAT